MPFDYNIVVIDNGSGYCKAGFAGQDFSCCVIPSVVRRPRKTVQSCMIQNDKYIGDQATCRAGALDLKNPITNGIVSNWDDMEYVWNHVFKNELRVDPSETPVIITEPALNPKAWREKTAQLMFETYNVPSFFFSMPSSSCSLCKWCNNWCFF